MVTGIILPGLSGFLLHSPDTGTSLLQGLCPHPGPVFPVKNFPTRFLNRQIQRDSGQSLNHLIYEFQK
jgi:hypothetical protein